MLNSNKGLVKLKMVRSDTSESNSKTIHLRDRKAVDAYNRLRDKKVNLSGLISDYIIQIYEQEERRNRHQALSKPIVLSPLANCSIDNGNGNGKAEELQHPINTLSRAEQYATHLNKHSRIINNLNGIIRSYAERVDENMKLQARQDQVDFYKKNSDTCYICAKNFAKEGPQLESMLERKRDRDEWTRMKKEQEQAKKRHVEDEHENKVQQIEESGEDPWPYLEEMAKTCPKCFELLPEEKQEQIILSLSKS
jgi:hypothetical protein